MATEGHYPANRLRRDLKSSKLIKLGFTVVFSLHLKANLSKFIEI